MSKSKQQQMAEIAEQLEEDGVQPTNDMVEEIYQATVGGAVSVIDAISSLFDDD